MEKEVVELRRRLRYVVEDVTHLHQLDYGNRPTYDDQNDLVIVDEADRLKMIGLEHMYIKYNLNTRRGLVPLTSCSCDKMQ